MTNSKNMPEWNPAITAIRQFTPQAKKGSQDGIKYSAPTGNCRK